MSKDTIYREDAIKALKLMLSDDINTSILFFWQNQTVGRGIDKIKNLPSADRPQGEWFKDENGDYRCSECGGCEEQFIYGTENWYGLGESKFCPSCGAQMKGADDETEMS